MPIRLKPCRHFYFDRLSFLLLYLPMGMTGNFVSLSLEDFNSIVEDPTRAISLVEFQIEDPAGSYQHLINEMRKQLDDPNIAVEFKEHYKVSLQRLEDDAKSALDAGDGW